MPTCKCGETDKSKFYTSKNRSSGYQYLCIKCKKSTTKQYYKDNKQHMKQQHTEWAKQNKELRKKSIRKYENKINKELKNTYIKKLLVKVLNVPIDKISQEMIDLKRTQLQLKRAIKNG